MDKSFVEVSNKLKELGIKNYDFMLKTQDVKLKALGDKVTEYRYFPTQNTDTVSRICEECYRNFWFFLRHMVKIPVVSEPHSYEFKLHMGSCELFYLLQHNVSQYVEWSRQFYTTTANLIWLIYVTAFHANDCLIICRNNSDVIDMQHKILAIKSCLPLYIQNKFHADDIKVETLNKVTDYRKYFSEFDNIFFEQFAYNEDLKYIRNNSQGLGIADIIQERKTRKYHSIVIASTPSDLKSTSGMVAFFMRKHCAKFIGYQFYDLDLNIMDNVPNGFILNSYTFKELLLSKEEQDEYENRMKVGLQYDNDHRFYNKEILLQWEGFQHFISKENIETKKMRAPKRQCEMCYLEEDEADLQDYSYGMQLWQIEPKNNILDKHIVYLTLCPKCKEELEKDLKKLMGVMIDHVEVKYG